MYATCLESDDIIDREKKAKFIWKIRMAFYGMTNKHTQHTQMTDFVGKKNCKRNDPKKKIMKIFKETALKQRNIKFTFEQTQNVICCIAVFGKRFGAILLG